MGHVEPIHEKVVVNIMNRLGDDTPFSAILFLDSALFSTSMSWIPVVDAQTSVEELFLATVPKSSAEVRRVFIHDMKVLSLQPLLNG